ncbi:hypothetical protein FHS91_003825 [Sphingobium xanthum]
MYTFSENAIPAIRGDIENVISAADTFLASQAQMLNTMIEAAQTSNIPLNATQRAYAELLEAMTSTLDARSHTGKTLATMTAIGRQSAHREMMEGCPGGVPPSLTQAFEEIRA